MTRYSYRVIIILELNFKHEEISMKKALFLLAITFTLLSGGHVLATDANEHVAMNNTTKTVLESWVGKEVRAGYGTEGRLIGCNPVTGFCLIEHPFSDDKKFRAVIHYTGIALREFVSNDEPHPAY